MLCENCPSVSSRLIPFSEKTPDASLAARFNIWKSKKICRATPGWRTFTATTHPAASLAAEANASALDPPRAIAVAPPLPRDDSDRAACSPAPALDAFPRCSRSRRASSGSRAAHARATSGFNTHRYTCAMDPLATGSGGKCWKTSPDGTPNSSRMIFSVCFLECRGASSCSALIASQKSSGKMSLRTDAHCAHFTSAAPQLDTAA
mmetsp:Transcript_5487/g.19823  ORF Transcript_5487/g.19823 Transcript_5487/m.19823 type:complete len:206 (-) Transcript_5487:735-1352(-)